LSLKEYTYKTSLTQNTKYPKRGLSGDLRMVRPHAAAYTAISFQRLSLPGK